MNEREYIFITCESKIRYKRLKNAQRALKMIKKSGKLVSSNFLPYQCKYCNGGWHLGHAQKKS